jgi:hypothetical protein
MHHSDLEPYFLRMEYYARHVRRLNWTTGSRIPRRYSTHHSVFRKICEHEDFRRPLFPNLKEVELSYVTNDPLTAVFYPSLVLSSSVETIHIRSDSHNLVDVDENYPDISNDYWIAMVGRMRTVAPALRKLKVIGHRFNDDRFILGKLGALGPIFAEFTSTMSCLKLGSLVLDAQALLSLGEGNLTGLTHLSISAYRQLAGLVSHPQTSLAFPRLERLSIRVASFEICETIINLLDAPNLKRLKLKAYMDHDDTDGTFLSNYDPQPLFHALQSRGTHTHLEQVHLTKVWLDEDDGWMWQSYVNEQRFTATPETFIPLQAFPAITSLIVDPCDTSGLNNEAFASMLGSWPRLEECILSDETFNSAPPLLTIWGVHIALRQVPSLQQLALRFDGTIIPEEEQRDAGSFSSESRTLSHPSLRMLNVGSSRLSPTTSGYAFATWLQKHYPKLAKVSSLTRYRSAMDALYSLGGIDDEQLARFAPYISLAIMVDRWNDVMEVYKKH